jgi:protein-disulfide isomerase
MAPSPASVEFKRRFHMQRLRLGVLGLCTTAMLSTVGCQSTGSFAQLQEKLGALEEGQQTILSRLDQLEEKVGAAAPSRPARADQPQRPQGPDPQAVYKVPLGDSHAKGPETAKVTIVAWSEFQCPFCTRVLPTLEQLHEDYGDDLRVVFKHNPLPMHNRAMAAAQAAEAAGKQGKFWQMHDKLFANQKDLTDENFETWAKEIGLDVAKFKTDMKDPAVAKKITGDQALGARLGARGTPAFFINGRFLSGAQPVAAFKAIIDEEMKKADKLIASGTPKNEVYDKAIERGKPSA